jgi:hypothetical protein
VRREEKKADVVFRRGPSQAPGSGRVRVTALEVVERREAGVAKRRGTDVVGDRERLSAGKRATW